MRIHGNVNFAAKIDPFFGKKEGSNPMEPAQHPGRATAQSAQWLMRPESGAWWWCVVCVCAVV